MGDQRELRPRLCTPWTGSLTKACRHALRVVSGDRTQGAPAKNDPFESTESGARRRADSGHPRTQGDKNVQRSHNSSTLSVTVAPTHE